MCDKQKVKDFIGSFIKEYYHWEREAISLGLSRGTTRRRDGVTYITAYGKAVNRKINRAFKSFMRRYVEGSPPRCTSYGKPYCHHPWYERITMIRKYKEKFIVSTELNNIVMDKVVLTTVYKYHIVRQGGRFRIRKLEGIFDRNRYNAL